VAVRLDVFQSSMIRDGVHGLTDCVVEVPPPVALAEKLSVAQSSKGFRRWGAGPVWLVEKGG